MAKFSGVVGYEITEETSRGVYEETIVERKYCGDIVRNNRRLQSSESINDSITTSNEISIVADPFANENFHSIRYVTYLGVKWKVTNVDVQYPRLIMTIGGIYNV